MKNRADEIIYLMRSHKGFGYRHVSLSVLVEFVRYEWHSNRWAMITETGTDRILGWISWYSLDRQSLDYVREYGMAGCFGKDLPMHQGTHVYICNTVVRENLPAALFRKLWNMALSANSEAETINAHLCNRNAPVWRWFSKDMRRRLSA